MKEDYDNDNKGNSQDTITRPVLYESLFELADIWCPNIDPKEYKEFFDYLTFRFRYPEQKAEDAYDVEGLN